MRKRWKKMKRPKCLSLTSDNEICLWRFPKLGSVGIKTPVNTDHFTKLSKWTDLHRIQTHPSNELTYIRHRYCLVWSQSCTKHTDLNKTTRKDDKLHWRVDLAYWWAKAITQCNGRTLTMLSHYWKQKKQCKAIKVSSELHENSYFLWSQQGLDQCRPDLGGLTYQLNWLNRSKANSTDLLHSLFMFVFNVRFLGWWLAAVRNSTASTVRFSMSWCHNVPETRCAQHPATLLWITVKY